MITVIFESHSTSFDNEKKIASGHYDVDLSPVGVQNAKELGRRRADENFDAIFTSDLRRAYKTAKLAFGDKFPIFKDARLREIDYGEFEHKSGSVIGAERPNRIKQPFPGGESFEDTSARMKDFLQELLKKYDGKKVMIIGHRATQYGLDEWADGKPLEQVVIAPWQWQPGWGYKLEKIAS